MKRKNNKKAQKKRQAKALKAQRRRKEFQKLKVEETTIHWDDLNFLENWKSLSPEELMKSAFKLDVEEWIDLYPKPRKDKDYVNLQDVSFVSEIFNTTIDDTLQAWSADTNGFTENLPDRWKFNEKNQTLFLSIMQNELEDWDEEDEQSSKELMENDRPEWFSVVFNDMLNEIVAKVSPYIAKTVYSWSFQ